MSQNAPAIDIEEAIRQLVINIHLLDKVRAQTEKFNIFRILKADRYEIRHSNMLAWLLAPKASHGLGDSFLKCFLQKVFEARKVQDNTTKFTVDEKLLLTELHRFKVEREYSFDSENNTKKRAIDLILTRDDGYQEKVAIVIENKIYSGEHSDQLQAYYDHITVKDFPATTETANCNQGWKHLFILLSPDGMPPSEGNNVWIPLSYNEVKKSIKTAITDKVISNDVHLIIRHYLDILDDISKDQDNNGIEYLCKTIYNQHRVAFNALSYKMNKTNEHLEELEKNLISEYRNEIKLILNHKIGIHDILFEYLKEQNYDLQFKQYAKRYIEFYTKEMDSVFPGGKGKAYKYFFYTWENSIGVYLELLGGGYDDYPETMNSIIDFQMNINNGRKRAVNTDGRPFNQYRRIYSKIEYIKTEKNIEEEVILCTEKLLSFIEQKQQELLNYLKQVKGDSSNN